MNKGKRSGIRLSVGGSSLLVIFVILTLTTFATLSLVSANADYKLSQKSMSASTDYYKADTQAEKILGKLDAALAAISGGDYLSQAETVLQEVVGVTTQRDGDTLLAFYTVTINDVQDLNVTLAVAQGPERLVRKEWKVVSTVVNEQEEGLNLWIDEDAGFFEEDESIIGEVE